MKVLNFNDPYVDSKGNVNNLEDVLSDISVDLTDYAKKTDIPTSLPANGGNADTVNNHTVESNVPMDAKFTDTIYDDTEIKNDLIKYQDISVDNVSYTFLSKTNTKLTIPHGYSIIGCSIISCSGDYTNFISTANKEYLTIVNTYNGTVTVSFTVRVYLLKTQW